MLDEIDEVDIWVHDEHDEVDDEVLEFVILIIIIVDDDECLVHDNERMDDIDIIQLQVVLQSMVPYDDDDDDIQAHD